MKRLISWIYGLYRWAIGKPVHCWEDKEYFCMTKYGMGSDEWAEAMANNATCFRLHGHFGKHKWTPDDQLIVAFPARNGVKQ